jgi:hypothetical protein
VKDPGAAMQAAIHAKLVASAAIATAMGGTARAHDKAPDPNPANWPEPFIRVGDDQVLGDSNGCADGWEVMATIHTFSRDEIRPRMVVKELMNHVAAAIGDDASPPAPAGFAVHTIELVQSRSYFEQDGITAHGVQTFRYLVADAA